MKNSRSKIIKIAVCVIAFIAVAVMCIYRLFTMENTATFKAMDTQISLSVKGIDGRKVLTETEEFVLYYDKSVLSRQSSGSVVYGINKNGTGTLPDSLLTYFKLMQDVSEKSGGAFDYTMGAVSDLWGIGTYNARVPEQSEIDALLEKCGTDKVTLSGNTVTLADGAVLDMGAAGKGMALDEIKKNCLDGRKISRAVIALGGSVLLYGDGEFTVGIKKPSDESGYAATLKLDACCVSTSGSYERYFEQDGKRYCHILDPETGYPVDNGLASVTIVSDSGALSDILSTACFVLGYEKSLALINEYGCEAVFIDNDGNVKVTDGLRDSIEIKDDNYILR